MREELPEKKPDWSKKGTDFGRLKKCVKSCLRRGLWTIEKGGRGELRTDFGRLNVRSYLRRCLKGPNVIEIWTVEKFLLENSPEFERQGFLLDGILARGLRRIST